MQHTVAKTVARTLRCYARRLSDPAQLQQFDDDVALDGKLEKSWASHCHRAGVEPMTVFSWSVQGRAESGVAVALRYSGPNALQMGWTAAQSKQLPRKCLKDVQADWKDPPHYAVRDGPSDDRSPVPPVSIP